MTRAADCRVVFDDGSCSPEPTDGEIEDWGLLAVSPSAVDGEWADHAMSAAVREANRAAYRVCRWVWEAAHASAGTTDRVLHRPRPGKVPAASLGWSESLADSKIEFAYQVLFRLPALGEGMRAGWLDESKVRGIVSTLIELDDEQARLVVDRILGQVPALTHSELRRRTESAAKAVDPAWAEARKAAAIARRRVVFSTEPSGAAALRGLDLELDAAQDAHDRIVSLAATVVERLRAMGGDASRGAVQADVMTTLTGSASAGMWDEDVISFVLDRHRPRGDNGPAGPEGGPDGPPWPGPVEPDRPLVGDCNPEDCNPEDCNPEDCNPEDCNPEDCNPEDCNPEDWASDGAVEDGAPAGSRRSVPFLPRVAVRLGLRTVLGLDARPGDIPGVGSVCSSDARTLAWGRTDAHWGLQLYDASGNLEYALTLRPPATGPPQVDGRRRRQVVWIHAHTHEVDELVAAVHHAPAPPPARGRAQDPIPGATPGAEVAPEALDLLGRVARVLAAARARPPQEHPAVSTRDAERRFPGACLRFWVLSRDLSCRSPGCAVSSVRCDVDHTHDFVKGGETVADDLGPFCPSDHLFKHDPDTGWSVTQTAPGRFEWLAPTGRRHVITPEVYDPLPEPLPRDGAGTCAPVEPDEYVPRPREPFAPRPNQYGHVTAAARDAARHLRERARERAGVPDPAQAQADSAPPF